MSSIDPQANPYHSPQAQETARWNIIDLPDPLPDFDEVPERRVELLYSLELDDFVEAAVLASSKQPRPDITSNLAGAPLAFFSMVGLAACIYYFWPELRVAFALGALGFVWMIFSLWAAISTWLRPWEGGLTALREHFRSQFAAQLQGNWMQHALEKRSVVVSQNGVLMQSKTGIFDYRWLGFCDVSATEDVCYLLQSDATGIVIPRRTFTSESDYLDFVRRVAGQVRKVQGKA